MLEEWQILFKNGKYFHHASLECLLCICRLLGVNSLKSKNHSNLTAVYVIQSSIANEKSSSRTWASLHLIFLHHELRELLYLFPFICPEFSQPSVLFDDPGLLSFFHSFIFIHYVPSAPVLCLSHPLSFTKLNISRVLIKELATVFLVFLFCALSSSVTFLRYAGRTVHNMVAP